MKNLYFFVLAILLLFISVKPQAQPCFALNATFQTFESRCAATGAIKVFVTGGSGNYKYKATGPVNTNFTTTDSITGLAAGTYTVEVVDVNTNCQFSATNVIVGGDYADPRFVLKTVSVSCDNGVNGVITVDGLDKGRAPFTFSIVAPSPSGVGTSNSTGIFTGLIAGDYSIRLTDSCGGIQTRTVSIDNYTWRIDSYSFTKFSCDSAYGYIKVIDSRGNISTITGIPGMTYGIVRAPGDTLWSTDPNFRFGVNGIKNIYAIARDACGNIKSVSTSLFLLPSLGSNVDITNKTCTNFTATVTDIQNFYNPTFCIYDQNDVLIDCNNTGEFVGLPYGSYCIDAHDACTDSTITRCFTVSAPALSVGDQVLITNKTCTSFTAAITGQVNLTNPTYCIFNSSSVLLGCNSTGIFTNLPYGDYCIVINDGCVDTTITRCISVGPPMPTVPAIIVPSYVNCVNFGLDIDGDSLTGPTYCLLDTLGNIIACNSTGVFDSIPLGSYCVTIHDACLDTTFERCFNVGPPVVANDMVVNISNKTCTSFTASVTTSNLAGSSFCLYDYKDSLIRCDSARTFTNLPYGSYCIKAHLSCPDTTVVTCFAATPPVPAVDASVSITAKTCSTFTATITGQINLTNPVYYLLNNTGDTVSNNATGVFANLTYESYCILIKDGCYDTTISRCFTSTASLFDMTASAAKSCNYGYSKFTISFNTYPATISIYDTANTMIYSKTVNGTTTVDSIPDLPMGYSYKIMGMDACGNLDSTFLAPVIGYLNHAVTVQQKCPGAGWVNGSGNINATVTTNTGSLTVRIVSKNGIPLAPFLTPSIVAGSVYTFQDMEPSTYVVRYNTNDGCNVYFYDTVTVNPYEYPNLSRSSAYQCDVNGFSVGAVVTNGVGPFTYEIIGSSPSMPSIVTAPQSNPVFTINNGSNYSLIRLRALDACGNATLGDASVLPLDNSGIRVSENCIGAESILKIDSFYNSTIAWYYKKNKADTDSTYLGDGFQLNVNPLTYADTGYYYCTLEINNGCIRRLYGFDLDGNCYPVLPVLQVQLTGRLTEGKSYLNWSLRNDAGLKKIIVERKYGDEFREIGSVAPADFTTPGQYRFTDEQPGLENFYRLRLQFENDKVVYSKVIRLAMASSGVVRVYPNPAMKYVTVEFNGVSMNGFWNIELMNAASQTVFLKDRVSGSNYTIHRTAAMAAGMYILKVTDVKTNASYNFKVIFENE